MQLRRVQDIEYRLLPGTERRTTDIVIERDGLVTVRPPQRMSPEQVDAFHAAGVANGGTTCENPPGWREGSVGKLYLAYVRDPDGNKLCALYRPAKGA